MNLKRLKGFLELAAEVGATIATASPEFWRRAAMRERKNGGTVAGKILKEAHRRRKDGG